MRSADFSNPRILSNLMSKSEKEKRAIIIFNCRLNKGLYVTSACVSRSVFRCCKQEPLIEFVSPKMMAFVQIDGRYLTKMLTCDIHVRKEAKEGRGYQQRHKLS